MWKNILTENPYRLRKIFNMGGGEELKQLWAKWVDRALARGVHGEVQGLAPWRGLQGAAAPCVRKFCILQANYA